MQYEATWENKKTYSGYKQFNSFILPKFMLHLVLATTVLGPALVENNQMSIKFLPPYKLWCIWDLHKIYTLNKLR